MIDEKNPPTSPTKSWNTFADAEGFCQNEMMRNMTNTAVTLFLTVTNVMGSDLRRTCCASPRRHRESVYGVGERAVRSPLG
jgi:hypothetical protein